MDFTTAWQIRVDDEPGTSDPASFGILKNIMVTEMPSDEAEHPKADEKCLKDFYLAEFKALQDEFAAVTLSLNTDYRFAITTSAAIVGIAATKAPEAMGYAVGVSFILTAGLWMKTLAQQGREGIGEKYLFHISQKLSGVIPLDKGHRSWQAAAKEPPPKSTFGRLAWLKGKSLNWGVLLLLQALYLVYRAFEWGLHWFLLWRCPLLRVG